MTLASITSIQLYSLRDLPSLSAILDVVAAAGYRHVELTGGHLETPEASRKLLQARGLTASSAHVGMEQLRGDRKMLWAACAELELSEIYMPAVAAEDRQMDAEGWSALGLELARYAEDAAKMDIRLGYHNHDWDVIPRSGAMTGLDLIFDAAGEAPLIWQADLAWIARAGGDPVAWLTRFGARLASVHVKDLARAGENADEDGWACPGHGVMDWHALWPAARQAGAGWMVMEHDRPRNPAAFARDAMAFTRTLEG